MTADIPRKEAKRSLRALRRLGIERISIFTGDDQATASAIAGQLGISDVRAAMDPEDKLRALDDLARHGQMVAMVGDGINDAPALARADVGIAMGGGGTAVAAEAADIVILNDDLDRLPEMIDLGRRTMSVIRTDIAIWFATNIVGFILVWTGFAGPAFAAFYNFATDFFPLMNSSRLFRAKRIARR
jgi:Cd2+/Zn2+-exporting ATPase